MMFTLIENDTHCFSILDCGLSETIEDFKDVFFLTRFEVSSSLRFFMKHELDKFNEVVQMMEIK